MNQLAVDVQVLEFLAQPLVARLAVNTPEGYPHVTPMWYLYDQGRFYTSAETNRQKVRLVQRDPRATLLIDQAGQGRMVMVHGTIAILADDPAPWVRRITARYIPSGELEDMVTWILSGPRVVFELDPISIIRFGSGWRA